MAMLITDPSKPDNPIVFANRAFTELTGYALDEVIGRNCRFLQGPKTGVPERARLRDGIARCDDVHVEILNYKKDGAPFWNSVFVSPVRSDAGDVAYFFASQLDVTERKAQDEQTRRLAAELAKTKAQLEATIEARTSALMQTLEVRTRLLDELDHRVKNNLQLMISMVNIERRRRPAGSERQALEAIAVRLHALGLVHRNLFNQGACGELRLARFIRQMSAELLGQAGRKDIELSLELEDIRISAATAAPIALLLNELICAALRFISSGGSGVLRLVLESTAPGAARFAIQSTKVMARDKQAVRHSVDEEITSALSGQLDASLHWDDPDPDGLVSMSFRKEGNATEAE